MPLVCSRCPCVFTSSKALLAHLRLEHALHYVGSTVQCGQSGCPRTFQNFKYFKSHLQNHHADLLSVADGENYAYPSVNECEGGPQIIDDDVMDADDCFASNSEQSISCSAFLTGSIMKFIRLLESKSNLTQANVQTVVEHVKTLLHDVS